MLTRKQDWQKHLHEFVDGRRKTPFSWGANDCALFVCDGIAAMTDTDIAADFRDKYTTQFGALKTIKEVTGRANVEDVANFVTAKFEMADLRNPAFAQRGDAVLFDGAEGPALGLVYLDGVHAVFVGEAGLRQVELKKCRRAWVVG